MDSEIINIWIMWSVAGTGCFLRRLVPEKAKGIAFTLWMTAYAVILTFVN